MKKFLTGVLLVLLSVMLIACGQQSNPSDVGSGISSDEIDAYSKEGEGGEGAVEISGDVTYDAYNPLTGEYDMASDLVGKRPIAVSVNNIVDCLPQYGIADADIIYEIETEGGITRLMAVYSDLRSIEKIGSVRSLRDQFMQCVYPFDTIIVHIGSSVYAKKYMSMYNYQTIDADRVLSVFFTDQSRVGIYDSEHTKFTSGASIYEAIDSLGFETDSYNEYPAFNFVSPEETVVPTSGVANTVNYDFSPGYDGDFRYDEATGKYLKWQHGDQHMDAATGTQLAFDNLFIVLAPIEVIDSVGCVEVNYEAGGTAYYISQGHYQELTWSKPSWSSNFSFTVVETGEELQVNTGTTHFAVIRTSYADSVEFGA